MAEHLWVVHVRVQPYALGTMTTDDAGRPEVRAVDQAASISIADHLAAQGFDLRRAA